VFFGTGTGYLAFPLAEKFQTSSVCGILISDPMRNEIDNNGIIDKFMRIKKDGHIRFYSLNELEKLFTDNGFAKENQVITDMKFPFAKQIEYIELYDQTTDKEKLLYDITNDNGVIWVKHINVGNIIEAAVNRTASRLYFL